ncbi:MAG: 2-polyprenyl-6-methoxyphenol hydroxylase-like FAD-dependent oxidoreductase [Planctomycetota bacterium]|jgi:2-polyprenyl-6-methoxyphenol hydroxylase-like FAD-dependent oxidoreductase
MFSKKTHFDCVILGGGPAGCVLAYTLADWGKSVCLIEKGRSPHPFPMQTIAADAKAVFKRNGIMTSMREAGHLRPNKRILVWGDGTPESITFSDNECGMRVDRELLDPDLRNLARARKVTVLVDAKVTTPLPEYGSGTVTVVQDGSACEIEADVFVVASGKTHDANLLPLALEHVSPALFALTATIHCKKKHKEIDVLEAIENGWLSWFTGSEIGPQFALFTNTPTQECREVIRMAGRLLQRSLSGDFAFERGTVRYTNATPRLVSTTNGALLIGDASCTIDPLLGRGIESSVLSAESAAVCVNTIIEKPGLRLECRQHLVTLEKARYFENLSTALGLYLREPRYSDMPFWLDRHSLCDVDFSSPNDLELPMKLQVASEVGRFPTLQRSGKLLERVIGMGKPGGPVHQTTLGIPVSELLDLVSENHWTDDVLTLANHHQHLYVHSKAKLTRALSELYRLGIIESATDSNKPSS